MLYLFLFACDTSAVGFSLSGCAFTFYFLPISCVRLSQLVLDSFRVGISLGHHLMLNLLFYPSPPCPIFFHCRATVLFPVFISHAACPFLLRAAISEPALTSGPLAGFSFTGFFNPTLGTCRSNPSFLIPCPCLPPWLFFRLVPTAVEFSWVTVVCCLRLLFRLLPSSIVHLSLLPGLCLLLRCPCARGPFRSLLAQRTPVPSLTHWLIDCNYFPRALFLPAAGIGPGAHWAVCVRSS